MSTAGARGTSATLVAPGGAARSVSLKASCTNVTDDTGATHRNSYRDIGMVMVVGTILALVVIITLSKLIGSF